MAGYIKIGDIKGQATDKNHKDWIDLDSVSLAVDRPAAGNSAKSQQSSANLGPIVVTKQLDKSTPKLTEAICEGKRFDVEIHLCTAQGDGDEKPYYQVKMTNAWVMAHQLNANGDPSLGDSETIEFDYEKIEWTYTGFGSDGKSTGDVKAKWNKMERTK